MNNKPDPELIDDENPEWTETMLKEAKSAAELFPQITRQTDKISATIEYDADIISAFRARGNDWQARMNDALREWLREHAT
ncbi:MAG: BrnA antitoxin family protein [Methylococcales bacterium]